MHKSYFFPDPVTKKFLVDHCDVVFGFPQLVRFSWSTAQNALENRAYHVEWEMVEEESESNKALTNNTSITSFFKMTKNQKEEKKEHEFFTSRFLSRKVDL